MLRYSAHALILSILALIFLGLVMLLSTGEFGSYSAVDPLREVKRQTVWLFIGLIGLLFAARVDYEVWQKTTWLLYGGTMVLLLLCFVPTIGESRNGASRWISGTHYGASFLRMQPSELGKLAAIIGMAAWYHKYQGLAETFKQGFFFPLLVAGGLVVPIVLEVDIGTSALILVVCGIMMFLAGVQFRWLIGSAVAGLAGLAGLVYMIPNRLERFLAFLNPEEHKLDAFYQQWQGLIALGSGGVHGLGIGKSVRKEFPNLIISIDTVRGQVAKQALEIGADIINDVSGGFDKSEMLDIV
ncbi:MAG: FtsW/RodA/SpoVE family cell cycle protein, partial [Verrucomicrobiota bacterium]